MFQAVFPPIIRSSNCTYSIWYLSNLFAAAASMEELGLVCVCYWLCNSSMLAVAANKFDKYPILHVQI
jgi:hypothetical protein